MTTDTGLPVFPLGTVLFPGGVLDLRIFEARYLDMIRECTRNDAPFGVCLITHGGEVGEPAQHTPEGCLARIVDWDMQTSGLLLVRAIGGERFRITSREIAGNGLIRARTEPIAADPDLPVPAEHADLAALLRDAVERHVADTPDPARRRLIEPHAFGSASWVSNRLAELLPVTAPDRHRLMTLDDPVERLALIHDALRRQRPQ
jgi:Lon protease-like protein